MLGTPYPPAEQRGITGVPARLFKAAAKIARLHVMNNTRNTLLAYSRSKPRGIKPYRLRLIINKMKFDLEREIIMLEEEDKL